jgi:SAM-dependent methyltransferase
VDERPSDDESADPDDQASDKPDEPDDELDEDTSYGVTVGHVSRRRVGARESAAANRSWWDAATADYQAEHGAFLRDAGFIWCPEGLDEADAHLLGEVSGRRVLEVGCGAAQCARWLREQGADVVAIDLSEAQLRHAAVLDRRRGTYVATAQADVAALPLAAEVVDLVCSAYGGLPFVADAAAALREIARVLRPGGRLVFSVTHPIRWCFPDDPGPEGLTARQSYFDRRPYVEEDDAGRATYVEHHRTLGDWVTALRAAGLDLERLVEPEWPEDHQRVWGQWSPLRGRVIPGTAIFVAAKPG